MKTDDPICGRCCLPRSLHYHGGIDCERDHNGSPSFLCQPTDETLLRWLVAKHPERLQELGTEWRQENGHE
jgi:hypothetical protein